MTRRQTPASTLAAWQASRDNEQARKLAAAHALAEGASGAAAAREFLDWLEAPHV